MISGWREVILQDVVEKFIDYRGKTPQKTTSGIPLVTAKIVKNGTILEPNEFVTEETYKNFMTRGFPNIDDVVLTTEAPLGEVALLKDDSVALAQRIILIRGKENILNNAYLKYFLQSEEGQYRLDSRASGTTVFGIKASVLKEMPIIVPSYKEQKAIAEVLSSLDDKIDLLHRQNKTLEELAQTLFRQWFTEEAKDEWEVGTLDEIMDFNPTHSLKKGEIYPFLEMGNVQTFKSSVADWYGRAFTSGTKFKNGDTLLARITPSLENGKTAYVDFLEENEIGWGSTEFIVMRMKENYHPFISYLIARNEDFREFAVGNMTGSTGRQRVQAKDLEKYEISIPPIAVIDKLNESIKDIPTKIKANSVQIKTLENMRDTLLPKLMSGEVKVEL
ncbi:MAG: restriction endonuclease subunit S [Arcobacteraceae bacterium]